MSPFVHDIDKDLGNVLSSLGRLKERWGGGGGADIVSSKEVVETQGMYDVLSDVVKHEEGIKKGDDLQKQVGRLELEAK